MKNVILLIVLLSAEGCHKSKSHDPNDYAHLSSQQVIDSLHFDYEKKYYILNSNPVDTVIFHSDNSITEILRSDTIIYLPLVLGIDSAFHFASDPNGVYHRGISLTYSAPVDTIFANSSHNYTFVLLRQTLLGRQYGGKTNDTLGAIGQINLSLVK